MITARTPLRAVELVLVLWLVLAAHAHAQGRDLGTIEVGVPAPVRLDDFVIASRLDLPAVAVTEVPLAAREALTERLAAREAVHVAAEELRRTQGADVERRRLDEAVARETAARTTLLDVLGRQESTLTRPALLLLGLLRYEVAAEAQLEALDRYEACLTSGAAACVEPTLDDDDAITTWARVDGGDLLAAHASYQRGFSAQQRGDVADARALFAHTLTFPSLPPRLEAETAFALGELAEDDPSALAAFARCAARPAEQIAPHCALRAASIELRSHQPSDALARVVPLTTSPEPVISREALRLAAEASMRLGDATSIPPAVARARDERLREIMGASTSPETIETWLAHAASFCADVLELDSGRLAVRGRARGADRPSLRTPRAGRELDELARCIGTHAPLPGTPLTGAFRAVLVLVPRAHARIPRVRPGEF